MSGTGDARLPANLHSAAFQLHRVSLPNLSRRESIPVQVREQSGRGDHRSAPPPEPARPSGSLFVGRALEPKSSRKDSNRPV